MIPDPEIGTQLGENGVRNVVYTVEQYAHHESRRIGLENHAPIVAHRAEFSILADEAQRIEDQLHDAPPPGELRRHRRKTVFAWIVTVILSVAGFFLAVLTFAPFRLGWQSYLFCLGIAVVGPFLIEELLEYPRWEPVVITVTVVAAIAGIASLMLLADVRGNLLVQEIQTAPAVVIDDTQLEQPPQNDFYEKALNPLRLATVLLSFAMELGAGLALRKAWTPAPQNADDWKRLRAELVSVRRQMVLAAGRITALEDEPAIFEARLWKDFYKSMLTHIAQNAMRKLLLVTLAVALIPHALAATLPPHTNLVIAIDLSKSVNVKGPDGITEFQKNVDGVTRVLGEVLLGTHITIIGIIDRSFAQPYILMSATVPDDAGYFGERLNAARQALVKAWKERSATLAPKFPGTDILGVLELAGQVFNQGPEGEGRRVLIIFSDMRDETSELNMDSAKGGAEALKRLNSNQLRKATLSGVDIYALGVDGAGEHEEEWRKIEEFWNRYIQGCGAWLKEYSVLREFDIQP